MRGAGARGERVSLLAALVKAGNYSLAAESLGLGGAS
jgi:hypothetical protein